MGIMMTSQMQAELDFWRGLVEAHGEFYYAYRVAEYYEKVRYFPSFLSQTGRGADIGCGCISVFEGSSKSVLGFDVLADEYRLLCKQEEGTRQRNVSMHGIPLLSRFVPQHFSWVACINMIDHTPDPGALIAQVHSLLPADGMVYFEVNLEVGIAPPHHTVWTEQTVHDMFLSDGRFRERNRFVQNVPEHNQRRYWAEFEVVK